DEAGARSRLLADGEGLGYHLSRRTAERAADALQETLARPGGHLVEDGGAEGVDEHLAAVQRVAQLVGAQPPSGDGLGELAQREVLHEGHGFEIVGPAVHGPSPLQAAEAGCKADNLRGCTVGQPGCSPRSFWWRRS